MALSRWCRVPNATNVYHPCHWLPQLVQSPTTMWLGQPNIVKPWPSSGLNKIPIPIGSTNHGRLLNHQSHMGQDVTPMISQHCGTTTLVDPSEPDMSTALPVSTASNLGWEFGIRHMTKWCTGLNEFCLDKTCWWYFQGVRLSVSVTKWTPPMAIYPKRK